MKDSIKITIEVEYENDNYSSHRLSTKHKLLLTAQRGRLLQTVDAIERKLLKLYPPELTPTPKEDPLT